MSGGDLLLTTVAHSIPQVKWKQSKMKYWLSKDTIRLIKKKRLLYHILKHYSNLRSKYNRPRNFVRRATRDDYVLYGDQISAQFTVNPKLFWRWVNQRKAQHNPIPACVLGDTVLSSNHDKAEGFKSQFSSREDLSYLSYLSSTLPSYHHPTLLEDIQVSSDKVSHELSLLNVSKACGPDLICLRLLKGDAPFISHSLANLFNKSPKSGILPLGQCSCYSNIQKREKHFISNYRPISLTCIVCKVLKKLIHHRLYPLLEQHDIFGEAQFDF